MVFSDAKLLSKQREQVPVVAIEIMAAQLARNFLT